MMGHFKDPTQHWSSHLLTKAILELLREKAHKQEGVTLEFILNRFNSRTSEEEIINELMCAATCIASDGSSPPVSLRLNLFTNKMRFWMTGYVNPESVLLPGRVFGPLYVFTHFKNEDWPATLLATIHQ